MKWAAFWNQFGVTVDSNDDLDDERKLAYLREAIRDPDTQSLLHSGTETTGLYQEVVATLKKRFDKTREIHRTYYQKLTQMGSVKATRADLRKFVDTLNVTIASIKHSGHYNLEAFLTSILHANIPVKLQTAWELIAKKTKGIPPAQDFMDFISYQADTFQ